MPKTGIFPLAPRPRTPRNTSCPKITFVKFYFAIQTHRQKRVGGILPENQPTPNKSIDEVQKEQLKILKSKKNLMLDE